eukprot:4884172-Pyramimonas_sp.AAC.1
MRTWRAVSPSFINYPQVLIRRQRPPPALGNSSRAMLLTRASAAGARPGRSLKLPRANSNAGCVTNRGAPCLDLRAQGE